MARIGFRYVEIQVQSALLRLSMKEKSGLVYRNNCKNIPILDFCTLYFLKFLKNIRLLGYRLAVLGIVIGTFGFVESKSSAIAVEPEYAELIYGNNAKQKIERNWSGKIDIASRTFSSSLKIDQIKKAIYDLSIQAPGFFDFGNPNDGNLLVISGANIFRDHLAFVELSVAEVLGENFDLPARYNFMPGHNLICSTVYQENDDFKIEKGLIVVDTLYGEAFVYACVFGAFANIIGLQGVDSAKSIEVLLNHGQADFRRYRRLVMRALSSWYYVKNSKNKKLKK